MSYPRTAYDLDVEQAKQRLAHRCRQGPDQRAGNLAALDRNAKCLFALSLLPFWGVLTLLAAMLTGLNVSAAYIDHLSVSVVSQPMTATGLAAGYPFEAWFALDKSADPSIPGYEVPAGATIRVTFPEQFTPDLGEPLEAVLLYGWPQMAIPSKLTLEVDPKDARTFLLRLRDSVVAEPMARPGLKAIHLRASLLNPNKAGDFPVILTFENAGELTSSRQAMAHITENPVPNIAAYNQLHGGRDEDWQHIKPGQETPIPVDYLVTLPSEARSSVRLVAASAVELTILSDGKPIGSIKSHGVPVTLSPEAFGPGYARLGIIRVRVRGGSSPGEADLDARLDSGIAYTVHIVIEP